ncbi:MAG: two-component system response regulator [Verrucomicrobiales bacterium]
MKKILLVDDEVGFTRLVKLNLEKTGKYTVRVINDSTEALEAMHTFAPDLALLDIVMPDLDGGDLVAQMKQDPVLKKIPVLMLTALVAQRETGGKPTERGDLTMIAKPVSMPTLIAAIQEKLGA